MISEVSNKNLEESVKKWNPDSLAEDIKNILIPMYAPYFVGRLHSSKKVDSMNRVLQYVTAAAIEFGKAAIAYELFI